MSIAMGVIDRYPTTEVCLIDDQHRILFELIERLERAIAAGKGASVIPQVLEELSQYTDFHSGTEELLMESLAYPLRHMHAVAHHKARRKLKEVAERPGDHISVLNILKELREWAETPVATWDTRLGEFLRASIAN